MLATKTDQERVSRLYPPRWQDVILRFASKVLNPASMSPGVRGHYERLLHERHWMVCHNACKGAKTDAVRKTLLTCQLCVSNSTSAEDTSDHLFRSCQHPLLCQARSQSGSILLTSLLLTDLDQRLFPVLLRLLQKEYGHRLCMGNWNSYQITQLVRGVHSRGRPTHGPRSTTPLFQTSVGRRFPNLYFLCVTSGSFSWDLYIVVRSKTSYQRRPLRY